MKKRMLITALVMFGFLSINLVAQNDQTLIRIENEEISLQEFEKIYKKNNQNASILDKKSLEEYLDLFINFKLKVHHAKELKLDKEETFVKEYNKYKNQLDKKYLVDPEITEGLVKEAYERLKQEVNVSHILIRCDANALPKDTVHAYKKAIRIRDRVMQGENFESVARSTSDDPSAKSNGGNMGYFSAFRMVYPFESGAYETPVGTVSMPVRSNFGYHLIKVNDKRPSKGEVQVAHIMLRFPKDKTSEIQNEVGEKANLIYHRIMNGESFEKLAAEFSEDKGTSKKGGVLPWFGMSAKGQLPVEFIEHAFNLKGNGMLSVPFTTMFGYHIIKRIDRRHIGSFEEMKPTLEKKVASDQRAQIGKARYIEKLKNEYNFTLYKDKLEDFYIIADSGLYNQTWDIAKANKYSKKLFSIGEKEVGQKEFAQQLAKYKHRGKKIPFEIIINNVFKNYVDQIALDYEKENLTNKFPDLKYLHQEYYDGILLFEISDRLVWTKAAKDSVNLERYYKDNKKKYKWGERAEIILVSSENEKAIELAEQLVDKKGAKRISEKYLRENLDEEFNGKYDFIFKKYPKGEDQLIKNVDWTENSFKRFTNDKKNYIAIVKRISVNETRTFEESKGLVISDYQKQLENNWIAELRSKYKIEVNKELLNQIK